MANFKKALKKVLIHEGNYSNDPNDPGGETYKGISRRAHPNWAGWVLIDQAKKDPGFPIILEENKELNDEIEELYIHEYWNKIKGDSINSQKVAEAVFDSCVLNGVQAASKLAQKASGAEPDGIIGVKTIDCINNTVETDFMANFMLSSIKRYHDIATQRQKSRKYFFGWVKRVFTYI